MTEADLAWLRAFLRRAGGLAFGPEKRYLIESRLDILCRRRGIAGPAQLVARLRAGDRALGLAAVEAMTTNETLFFRDRVPFEQFAEVILPDLLRRKAGERRLRIWSAAASTGQEPYSLAMILDEMAVQLAGWSVDVLATDLSGEVVERAREGLYSQFEVQRGLPVQRLLQHFLQEGERWRLKPAIRGRVRFQIQNLIEPTAHLGRFDVIFCRNVLLYFDVATRAAVLNRLVRQLRPGGYLLLGAAETVLGLGSPLIGDPRDRGLYRLPADAAPPVAPASRSDAAAMAQAAP